MLLPAAWPSKRRLVLILSCVVLLALVLLVSRGARAHRQRAARLLMTERCKHTGADTVFVQLHGPEEHAAGAVTRALEQAACPQRIRVALPSAGDASRHALARLTARAPEARLQVRREFSGERYQLLLHTRVQLAQHWDEELIKTLRSCAMPAKSALVCAADRVVSGGGSGGSGGGAPFPCADAAGLLHTRRTAKTGLDHAVPALLWVSSTAFVSTAALQAAGLPGVAHPDAGARLWMSGVDFFAPPKALAFALDAALAPPPGVPPPPTDVHGTARSAADYGTYCGISAEHGVSARARMGLLPDAPPHEVLIKYGSWQDYEHMREQMLTHTTTTHAAQAT
jgi:hypothetical protein